MTVELSRPIDIAKIDGVLTATAPEQKVADALLGVEDVAAILAAVDVPGAGEVEFAAEVLGWLLANGTIKPAIPGASPEDGGYPAKPADGRSDRQSGS